MDISFDTNNLEISEVYKGLLEKPSSNSLEIDEEVVFYHINHSTLGKQVFLYEIWIHQSKAY